MFKPEKIGLTCINLPVRPHRSICRPRHGPPHAKKNPGNLGNRNASGLFCRNPNRFLLFVATAAAPHLEERMLSSASGGLPVPAPVPLDPTRVNFLRVGFHHGAIDVWLAVADRPLEEGTEAPFQVFFEDKERKIRGAYHEAMDEDEESEDEDEEEGDDELFDKDVKHANDEQVSTEDEQEYLKGRIAANSESLTKEGSYPNSLKVIALVLICWRKGRKPFAKLLIPKEVTVSSEVKVYDQDEETAEAKVSSEVNVYDEDEETAVVTGKPLAHEKKHARNEEIEISAEGEQESKMARVEESPC
ncbi:hypothetical protein ACP70R_004300 [Stipagrostis hirtigluma subsp. patula]